MIIVTQYDRIVQMMVGDDGSAITRYSAFLESYQLFLASPLTGVGFGAIRGLDLLGFLLATTGIIGLAAFFYIIFKFEKGTSINLIFIQGLKATLMVTLISNPILDHTFLWVIFAFITVPLKLRTNKATCQR